MRGELPKDRNYLHIAREYIKKGNYREAIRFLQDKKKEANIRDNPSKLGRILAYISVSEYALGNYSSAKRNASRAYKILRRSTFHKAVALAQGVLGKTYFAEGQMEEAKSYLEDAIATYRRIQDKTGVLNLNNFLARIHLVTGKYREAVRILKKLLKETPGTVEDTEEKKLIVGVLYSNLGVVYVSIGEWYLAEEYIKRGLELLKEDGGSRNICIAYKCYGYIETIRRNWGKAERFLNEALEICKKYGYKREEGVIYEHIGHCATEKGDYKKAKVYLERARKIAKKIAPNSHLMAQTERRLGNLWRILDKPEDAINSLERSLRLTQKLQDRVEEGVVYRNLALVYEKTGEVQKARSYYEKSLDIMEESEALFEMAITLREYGCFLFGYTQEIPLAQSTLLKAQDFFKKLRCDYWVALTHLDLARLYLTSDEPEKAFYNLDEAEVTFVKEGRDDELEIMKQLRTSLEKKLLKLVPESIKTYTLLLNGGSQDKFHSSLDDIIKTIGKKINNSRGFLALRKDKMDRFAIEVRYNMRHVETQYVIHRLLLSRQGMPLKEPFISSNIIEGDKPRRISIIIPLHTDDELNGYLYVDRETTKGVFSREELIEIFLASNALNLNIENMKRKELERENLLLREELRNRLKLDGIVTQNRDMLKVIELIDRTKDLPIPILLVGETGTGKELIARIIHYNSKRARKPYVPINCANIPPNLLETELFGYKRGAFTDAKSDKKGWLETADGGTVFLDEISEMDGSVQAKLLRFLEYKEISPIGSRKIKKLDVRIIAASNRNMEECIKNGKFREDLFYRLKGVVITLPPLRERPEDIPILVNYFIEKYSKEFSKDIKKISEEVMNLFLRYTWPGNVRELENEIKRAIVMANDSGYITTECLSQELTMAVKSIPSGELSTNYADYVDSLEKTFILDALRESNGNIRKAARILSIPESTLRYKIKRLSLRLP